SIAITISIPLVVFVFVVSSTVLGRAIATINAESAKSRSAKSKGFNRANQFFLVLKPEMLEIFSEAICCFRFHKYHSTSTGSIMNNQKNCGFTNSKLLPIFL